MLKRGPRSDITVPARTWRRRVLAGVAIVGVSAATAFGVEGRLSLKSIYYYSTAEAPRDYRGPVPTLELALNRSGSIDQAVIPARGPEREPAPTEPRESEPAPSAPASSPAPAPAPPSRSAEAVPRVASSSGRSVPPRTQAPAPRPGTQPSPGDVQADPIALARQAIAACQARYRQVNDYVCTFHKRERIGGHLTAPHIMTMKARSNPTSIYFKFQRPNKGREAIYVAGRNGGKVIAHDVGLGKLFAGTLRLDPRGSMAMEDNRHPVTEAGIGSLIDTVARHWATELSPEESRLTFHPNVRVGNHPCTMIESVHPRKRPDFLFYMVKLYINHEHGLPIRFEAYDWPKHPGAAPELVEEYTYLNLRVNVGLRDGDFDPANPQYSYGRF